MTGHPYDDLEALALGDLDPVSAEIVMRHADACPTCGTGALPTGDVLLKAGDVPKKGDVFQTLDHEHFVSERLPEAIIAASITGDEFHRVRDARAQKGTPGRLVGDHAQGQGHL